MAQFYTLEEAARVLGMSAEELKVKAQSREVRAFLDGGSWRFRVVDVDELARRRGLGSDAELRLSDLEVPIGKSGSGEMEDLDLSEFHMGVSKPDLGSESAHISKVTTQGGEKSPHDSGSDHDILLDDLTVPPNQITGSSSVIIGAPSSSRKPSDSDVRLVPDPVKGSSDSDVQLASPGLKQPSDSDVTLIKEDTADFGMIGSGSSSDTSVRVSPLLGSSAEVPASDSDSDFELNPSSELIDALQPDSGSDFELSALDPSDEFEATPLSRASDSDVTASDPKLSGINLSRPSDSGINLQTGAGLGMGQADSIELAPLSDEELKSTAARARPSKPKPSLAATPPPAVKKGEKDIFDDTDFEVDVPLESDSDDKTVQLEAASDFDLEDSDTGSEVFAIDEEAVDQNASTAMAPSAFAEDDDEEEDDGFDSAVSSEMGSAWATSDTPSGAERASQGMVLARESDPEWSGLWVGLLGFTTICLFFAAFVAHDLVRNLYEFQSGGTMGSGLVHQIARMFGG